MNNTETEAVCTTERAAAMLRVSHVFRAVMKKTGQRHQMRHRTVSGDIWREGFTLLEVMVAIFILAVGLVAVLELLAGSLRLTGKASHRTQAVIHAQNVMDGLFAQGFLEDGEESGELPQGFFWRAHVQEIFPDEIEADEAGIEDPAQDGQTSSFHIKEITVSIRWEEGESRRSFDLRSMRVMYDDPTNSLEEEE